MFILCTTRTAHLSRTNEYKTRDEIECMHPNFFYSNFVIEKIRKLFKRNEKYFHNNGSLVFFHEILRLDLFYYGDFDHNRLPFFHLNYIPFYVLL